MTAAIALFLFGGITTALSLQLPIGTVRVPGSGLYPLVLGLMLMGLAATQALRLHLSASKAPSAPATKPTNGATQRVLLFMGAVVIATGLLVPLGYFLVSILLMFALLHVLGLRPWYASALIALASAVACQVIFVHWLKIPLPSGLLGL